MDIGLVVNFQTDKLCYNELVHVRVSPGYTNGILGYRNAHVQTDIECQLLSLVVLLIHTTISSDENSHFPHPLHTSRDQVY